MNINECFTTDSCPELTNLHTELLFSPIIDSQLYVYKEDFVFVLHTQQNDGKDKVESIVCYLD